MNVTKNLFLTPYLTLSNGTQIDATKELEDYGYRTMWDIFRSCAFTILACTWAIIHSNIPSHRGRLAHFYYKVQLWLIALIMPDLLLLWSAKQFYAARRLVTGKDKEEFTISGVLRVVHNFFAACLNYVKRGGTKTPAKDDEKWSMPRAFLVLMGGVTDDIGDILSPYDSGQSPDSFVRFLSRCGSGHHLNTKLKDEEIQDKSKADFFVKSLALIQTLWFVGVTIHRIQSRKLYATEAEIVTMTFSFLSFFTYLFWWNKPQAVKLPIPSSIPSQQNPSATPQPQGANHEDALPPHCFALAISILESDNTTTYGESIPKSDVYAYVGKLSLDGMSLAVLWASSLGSLCGVCHLTVASLNHGLIMTVHGPIWFSLALLGSALSFYLLVVISISISLRACGKETERFLRYGLHKYVQGVLLIVSVIGRMALIVALVYFMFTPYDYPAFLEPNWSRYFPHPF